MTLEQQQAIDDWAIGKLTMVAPKEVANTIQLYINNKPLYPKPKIVVSEVLVEGQIYFIDMNNPFMLRDIISLENL